MKVVNCRRNLPLGLERGSHFQDSLYIYSAESLTIPYYFTHSISRLKHEFIRPYYYFAKITVLCVIFVLQRTSKWGKWFSAVGFMFHSPTSPF